MAVSTLPGDSPSPKCRGTKELKPILKIGPSHGHAAGKKTSRYDVCEVFSPPRICPVATEQGLRGGWSIDMAVPEPGTKRRFDLRNQRDQNEVKRRIRRDGPTVVVVSPPCTAFSIANQGEVDKQTLSAAVEMIRFSLEICELQHRAGRFFIFEQPQSSRAWRLTEVVNMTYRDGVTKTTFHQCMYGLVSSDHHGEAPAYKPTSVLTNHPSLAEVLQEKCDGGHRHAQLVGKGACSRAACYPRGLCSAVVKGIHIVKKRAEELDSALEMIEEARRNEPMGVGSFTDPASYGSAPDLCPEDVLYTTELEDMCEQDPSTWENLASQRWQEYSQSFSDTVDSTTGETLDPATLQAGCDEALGFMSQTLSHTHLTLPTHREVDRQRFAST